MYDSIIFDLDGTMWDSTDAAARVWDRVAKRHGVEEAVTGEKLKALYGLPLEDIALKLFKDVPEQTAISIMEESVSEQCAELIKDKGILLGDVENTLEELCSRYKLLIVSNCKNGYIEAFLEGNGFGKYFTDFECPGRTGKFKADNIKMVIERNNLKAPVYVGDTEGDGKAAREAGIPFIFAAYGFGSTEAYDYKISRFSELTTICPVDYL